MGKFENVVQSAVEQLLEDGGLRSNLTDDEANTMINWAIAWLTGQVDRADDEAAARQVAQAELRRLRSALKDINRQLAESETPRASDRKMRLQSLIAGQAEAWGKKEGLVQQKPVYTA